MELDALKAFVAAEDFTTDALNAAHAAIFPDCFIYTGIVGENGAYPVRRSDEVEGAVATLLHAAMYKQLGHQTQLSRGGLNVVFAPEFRQHRADLSGIWPHALSQLKHAGIDWTSVTIDEVNTYYSWRTEVHQQRAIEGAYFLITRKFNEAYSGHLGSASWFNNVRLVSGLGYLVDNVRIECCEVRRESGLFGHEADYEAIEKALAKLRKDHPKFSDAEVRDNNKIAA